MGLMINPEQAEKTGGGGKFDDRCTPGRKLAHAVGMSRWTSKGGTPMVSMGFVVLRDAAEGSDDTGKVFIERFALTDRAAWRIGKWAHAAGHRAAFAAESDDDWERIMARGAIVAELEEDEYNGRTRVQVKEWAAYSGQDDPGWEAMVTAGEQEWQRIQQRLADARSSGGGSYGSSSGSAYSAPASAPGPADDIPF